jgi:hypothetical protein
MVHLTKSPLPVAWAARGKIAKRGSLDGSASAVDIRDDGGVRKEKPARHREEPGQKERIFQPGRTPWIEHGR